MFGNGVDDDDVISSDLS